MAGTDHHFRLDEFADTMRSRIVSVFSDALATAKIPVLDVATRYQELGEALLPLINPLVEAKYGLEIASFILENVSVPPEVERPSTSARAWRDRQPERLREVPDGARAWPRAAASGGAGAELAVGMAIAQQMMKQPGGFASRGAPAGRRRGRDAAAGAGAARAVTPADAAKALGVTEADVMASLEAGDLKGKKIGTHGASRRPRSMSSSRTSQPSGELRAEPADPRRR